MLKLTFWNILFCIPNLILVSFILIILLCCYTVHVYNPPWFDLIQFMVCKSAKTTSLISMVGVNDDIDNDDIISKLPDDLIHHILSFLPTRDVILTCLLSKRWKLIWYSVPALFFANNSDDDNIDDLEKFYNYVNEYLKHRKKGMYFIGDSSITSFKFEMHPSSYRRKDELIDKWLAFAIENNVKEIHFSMYNTFWMIGDLYYLPKIIDKAKYLTILELKEVNLDASCSFSFPSLKTLSLNDVWNGYNAKDDGLAKFLLGCPSLEKLRLHDYAFLDKKFQFVQSSILKFMEFTFEMLSFSYALRIEVDAINLESLVLNGVPLDRINLSSCKKITSLALFDCYCKKNHPSSLEILISNLPLLENLTLSYFNLLHWEYIEYPSQHMRSSSRKPYDDGVMNVVTIKPTSKLTYFCYEGNINFSISVESSNSLYGKIVIHDRPQKDYDTNWFIDMINFLVNLKCSWNMVTLHVSTYKALIWPENLKNICRYPLLNWKHLGVITNCDPEKEIELKDALMWISPSLESLSINEKVLF
ncbi:F-box/FBD/LRR-repeat protein At2g04230-like [Cannabis sativa]|uniref:F-box/FBD/LRR-repeat protein At2g04230-like n=1 Tax=Cannabis sativa TaxID=3483 RepID=UPI0029CA29ED|nr:F-box/FBD/LRR-repeat protein At2g04230-like [Cannabis sativa]